MTALADRLFVFAHEAEQLADLAPLEDRGVYRLVAFYARGHADTVSQFGSRDGVFMRALRFHRGDPSPDPECGEPGSRGHDWCGLVKGHAGVHEINRIGARPRHGGVS